MVTRVIGLGAGGHAKVVIEILRFHPEFALHGLLDSSPAMQGQTVLDVPVLGFDEMLENLRHQSVDHFFVGLGTATSTAPRKRLFEKALALGFTPVDAIHPTAVVSPSAAWGPGVTVLPLAVINAQARLGANVIVNTGAIVEHDCQIADHVHLGPGVRLGGSVEVGEGALIGIGAILRPGVRIGRRAVVGAGAVVVKDVPDEVVVVGSPARLLRTIDRTA